LRNVAAAVLAVPVLAVIYLPVLARRSIAVRIALVLGIGLIVALGALGLSRPAPIAATAPAAPITALADDAFRSIGAATDLKAPVRITFSQKMDPTSVAGTLVVSPATQVNLAWDATGTTLTISPRSHWQAATYHTISLDPGALGASGRPMSSSVRAAFVTRPATSGKIAASQVVGETAPLDASFRFTFDRPVETSSLTAALRIAPALDGKVEPVSTTGDTSASQATTFVFSPTAALAAGTTYKISTEGLVDADGATLASAPTLTISTIAAAHVVRFRPVDGSKDVDPRATLSVRFSTAMKHATTSAAVTVTANGKPVAGAVSFAEGNTVVVFKPKTPFLYNAKVVMRVAATATTTSGTALAAVAQTSFTAAARPGARAKPPAPAAKAPAPTPKPITTSGGGAVGGGSWGAVETYYLKLMNCTRTGGWVTSTGSCSSPGGRNVAALRLDSGISTKVSRPYAKKLAVNNLCTHFSGGNPGNRLSAAGYTSYIWAENLGCRSGNPYSAVLGSHLFFQSEKSYSGGHYVNMMNAKYDRVGIGVWVSGGRVRLVIDFYHPR
jgi:uncharacterized protein YkwD